MAKVDPHHLMFSIWAATQTYADFDWQISTVTGKASLDEADYEAAAQTIIRMVIKGCEIAEDPAQSSEQVTLNVQ
jgi:TetR/AcrR family transcriptional regulator